MVPDLRAAMVCVRTCDTPPQWDCALAVPVIARHLRKDSECAALRLRVRSC